MEDIDARWEQQMKLNPGELDKRLRQVWLAGEIGTITEAQVHSSISEMMGWSEVQVNDYMQEIWTEYLGTLNVELADYFRSLRPRYQTAIISNSFVGAREKEQESYNFGDICDFILYSHEVGFAKPDPRIYLLACERLGLPPAEIVFVDDYEGAVEGALNVGMQGIIFRENRQVIAELEALFRDSTG